VWLFRFRHAPNNPIVCSMQITVFGASGKVGRQVVILALEHGHEVNAFVHSHNPYKNEPRVKVFKGNVKDKESVTAAIQGSDAVISALGSWGTKSKNIVSSGMVTIIPAMQEQDIARLVTVTGAGAFWSKDKPGLLAKAGHSLIRVAGRKVLQDSEKHLELLEKSSLLWTAVRSPIMTNNNGITYTLGFKAPGLWALIPRKAVAESLLDLAENNEYPRQAPFISN
jgi:putative NADH-flavin reductase